MPYAEVSVNSPVARRQLFSYAIPEGLNIDIGQAVWVPFGDRVLQGIVLELSSQPSVEQTRDIISIIDQQPLLSTTQVALARWLSDYYLCPLFDAIAPMLPPGFERKTLTFISTTANAENCDPSTLTPAQRQAIELARKEGRLSLKQLEKALGKKRAQATVSQLVARNLVARSYRLEPVRVKPKQELVLNLAVDADRARQIVDNLRQKGTSRQAALLEFLSQCGSATITEARKSSHCQAATIRALQDKGLISAVKTEVKRQPIDYKNIRETQPLEPNASQQSALSAITQSLKQNEAATFLLFGVTGSGKTEVYLRALAEAVRLGKRGIVLVPEISLTPQTIERFASRFPGRVAVIHSRLSLGERFDQWRQIKNGDFDVVIGARSAVFAPQPDLGLIVIDEEHEWSYKQDISPRYHARSVAIKLAELTGAAVVLGSATPDVESFYHAKGGDYHLLELPRRITPHDGSALPRVEVVDMKDELKAGNTGIFSCSLRLAIDQALAKRGQVILFFNRRGAATFVQCRSCGLVLQCRRCNASLNYHSAEDALVCHHCNYKIPVPKVCPQCHSRRIKFLGIGTQKLEQEARLAFPKARLLRWDSDAVRGRHSHQQIMERFSSHQADILIGTQMVAKGLDLPQVTLVGVVSADTGLNLPDFRAGERSFQLLSQVAGRAGRGPMGGRVIIQSFCPGHYAIQAALKHDYTSFYNQEIEYRRQLHNPPFSQLVRLTFSHINDNLGYQEAIKMKRTLALEIDATGAGISLIGPTPAFIHRLRGRFRWQLMLRGSEAAAFLSRVALPQGWAVDVDPVGL